MIKTEKIPSTKTIHKIYCDDCGKFITSSVEYDDGYYKNPADFSCSIYTDDRYTLEKELCEECKQKYYTKIRNALLEIGFKVESEKRE